MVINKNLVKIAIVISTIVVLSSGILLKNFFSSFDHVGELESHYNNISSFNELSSDILLMTVNLQDYITYSNGEYLDVYLKHSSLTLKKELELLNNAGPTEKQEITDLMELTKSYISFVDKEVIPVMQAKNYSTDELRSLHARNKVYSQELTQKVHTNTKNNHQSFERFFQDTIIKMNGNIMLLLVILLSSLLVLPWVAFKTLYPLLTQCFYLDRLAKCVKCASIFVDNKGYIKYINNSAKELFGVLPSSIQEKNIQEVPALFPHLQSITQPLFQVILQQKEITKYRIILAMDGRNIDLSLEFIPVIVFNKPAGAMLVATIADAQKDKPLLLDTLEKERKRISIEIHDWIGRYMSTIIHSLDYILRLNKNASIKGELLDSLMDLRSHCQTAAIEMRGIMNDIHPYLIDKVGLISALESFVVTFEKLNKIKVYILYQDRALRISKKDEIIIYRIIQEGLSNIAKHAKATEVDISFTVLNDVLKIELQDNGGSEGDFVVGKGLWGMKERANLMGGEIVFGQGEIGFCVTLTVPILPGGQLNEQNKSNVN